MKTIRNKLLSMSLILVFHISYAQQKERTPVSLEKITESLYEVVGGRGANGGLYIGENGLLLIDTKMDEISVKETIQEIRRITDKPIRYIVNTHSDGDHINGNRYFPSTVTIVAHENCRNDFFLPKRDGSPSDWSSPELQSFIPSLTFRDKMDIFMGSGKTELWYFGIGHTTGDIVVYFPEEKTAFIGDQLFITRPQLIHSYKGGNSFEHVKTLTRMLDKLEAENFCSGHDDITNREEIQKHIADLQEKQQKVRSFMQQHKNLEEIKSQFEKAEGRIIEVIFKEISGSKYSEPDE
jgi:cyclase